MRPKSRIRVIRVAGLQRICFTTTHRQPIPTIRSSSKRAEMSSERILASQRQVDNLVWKLRRRSAPVRHTSRPLSPLPYRQLVGSRETALETLQVIRQVVLRSKSSDIEELISTIKTVGRRLSQAQPKGKLICMCLCRTPW
jgi:hypothetical protein